MEDTTHSSQAAYVRLPAVDSPASDAEAAGQAAASGGSHQGSLWQRITTKPGATTILPTFLLAAAYVGLNIWFTVWMGGDNGFAIPFIIEDDGILATMPVILFLSVWWLGGPAVALYCCLYAVRAGPHRPRYMKYTLNAGPMLLHFVISSIILFAFLCYSLAGAW